MYMAERVSYVRQTECWIRRLSDYEGPLTILLYSVHHSQGCLYEFNGCLHTPPCSVCKYTLLSEGSLLVHTAE